MKKKTKRTIKTKQIPFEFVLEQLSKLEPRVNRMFGCHAIYIGEKIVFILRERNKPAEDDGIWLATTPVHHASLALDFPSMRSISIFGPGTTGWQVLPSGDDDFETAALRACELVLECDPRIGKIPKSRLRSKKAIPRPRRNQ